MLNASHANVIRLIDVRASTPGGECDPNDLPTLVFPPADVDLHVASGPLVSASFHGFTPGGTSSMRWGREALARPQACAGAAIMLLTMARIRSVCSS